MVDTTISILKDKARVTWLKLLKANVRHKEKKAAKLQKKLLKLELTIGQYEHRNN